MRSVSIEYYPGLKNITAYISNKPVMSVQRHEFDGWVITRLVTEHKDKPLLDKVQRACWAKLKEVRADESTT